MRLKKLAAVLFLLISLSPSYASDNNIYDSVPAFSPYYAGKVRQEVLNDALKELNYIRGLIGVPSVTLNDDYNNKAQHGAVLLDAIDTLTHTPGKPSDMSESFYELGYDAASHGNLAWGSAGMTLNMSTKLYMDDSDSSNISRLGHRRWFMNPRMRQVGFGISTRKNYAVTYVIEELSRSGTLTQEEYQEYLNRLKWPVNDEYITWPVNKNPHPLEYFGSNTAWSVVLNSNVFDSCNDYSVTVHLIRESDGKTWLFGKNGSNGYFTVNHEKYAYDECIIFRPDNPGSYSGTWRVEVYGLTRKDGKAGNIAYTVNFSGNSQDNNSQQEAGDNWRTDDDYYEYEDGGEDNGSYDYYYNGRRREDEDEHTYDILEDDKCNVSGSGIIMLIVLGILHVKFVRDGR